MLITMTTRTKPAQIAMEKQNTLLAREFEKAEKATVISETLQHLDKFRITTDTKVQEEEGPKKPKRQRIKKQE